MKTSALVLPDAAAAAVVAEVAEWGFRRVETAGFLLASRGREEVTAVALAGTSGIVRRRDLVQISDIALDRLFAYADHHGLWIPAQFHSHYGAAFMSPTDLDHGLSVEGFVSTIVPFFTEPPSNPAEWGWWCYQQSWQTIQPPRGSSEPTKLITFDEAGVRDD
jgi:hypothetical protein